MDSKSKLLLDNQLCFPIYAASRLIIRAYQPYLDELGITYPQYLVLMVLWEKDEQPVNDIAKRLLLQTNTITPLLQRMEKQGLIARQKSAADERKVIVSLTEVGVLMFEKALPIPEKVGATLLSCSTSTEDLVLLKNKLTELIETLSNQVKE